MAKRDSRWRGATLAVLFSMAAFGKQALAFDAGHHHDITRSVLTKAGFVDGAVNSAILANWLTDYYSNAPSSNPRLRPFLQTLHFDNLADRQAVNRYHGWLIHNAKRLTQEAALNNDRIQLLGVIGIASHAIQDFYSHSNWVDAAGFEESGNIQLSLFQAGQVQGSDVFTGTWPQSGNRAHGSYDFGLNKDSHVRPGWEEAFVHAHEATVQLVKNMQVWAEQERPGFWRRTAQINPARLHKKQLLRDLNSAREISMFVRAKVLGLPASDGHWKGNLSGDSAAFAAEVAEFTSWKNSYMTRYFRTSRLPFDLADKLMSTQVPPAVTLAPTEPSAREVLVFKIHSFTYLGDRAARRIGTSLTVNGSNYTGRRIRVDETIPADGPAAWAEIHIDEPGTTKYEIELVMNGYRGSGSSREVTKDINFRPDKNKLQLVYDSRSGELSGDIYVLGDGQPQRVTVSGDGERSVSIVLSVYTRKLVAQN